MMVSAGAARRSSVLGLNDSPSTATVLPRGAPMTAVILATMRCIWWSFAAMVASTMPERTPASRANADRAWVSLGKHEPP